MSSSLSGGARAVEALALALVAAVLTYFWKLRVSGWEPERRLPRSSAEREEPT